MTRRGAAAALALCLLLAAPGPAFAAPERQVILLLLQGVSYEEALRDPLLMRLSRAGGIGLLTTGGEPTSPVEAAASLGAGGPAAVDAVQPISVRIEDPAVTVSFREGGGDAEPGLLGSALAEAGRSVGYVDLDDAAADPAMLVAMDAAGRIPLASLNTFPTLAELPPEFLAAGLERVVERADLVVTPDPEAVELALEASPAEEVLVIVVVATPSAEMRERGDTVTPVLLARGTPAGLRADGRAGGLSSDTTRRQGVVANVDVAPTVVDFLGVPVPEEMLGSPIHVDGSPPTDLHRRYLEWRRVAGPVGLGVLGLALAALFAGLVVLFGKRAGPGLARAVALAGLLSVASLVVLVPASLLPSFTSAGLLGTLTAGGLALTAVAVQLGRRRPSSPVAVVAAVGLAIVVLDVSAGWVTGETPLLGGSALDGERFFGLGNPYAGIVLSGAVLVAAKLRVLAGVALLAAAALFAGLPFLGADVGGSLTLAVAAGLWFGLARWDRFGWRAWAVAGGAALLALGIVIVSHRLLPPGTHVAAATASGPLGAVEIFWDRLLLNIRATSAAPFAWLAILALPIGLAIALRPPAAFRPALEEPAWRRAAIVLAIGGIVGYVLNDTFGMAGIASVFLSAALVYPALARRAGAGPVRETSPASAPADG